ncbi:glyoxalase/bleomycin resistance/extradiol dioxygenase family protein [Fibrisoma montanum]|uniref:Glyoxalase/bleomycin resistance/extradiol dioxygenase family protein n=1 Tax=Fibrisoma montanum TaxID=2305895 RepID=A0A418MBN2_9BACT|nr:VOC family protein [Fibrisoma montanum]RIV23777.1 glyoxalase/bleomycin resistance/extradiol dioxygenase family protein [Fibrisoma montanum]
MATMIFVNLPVKDLNRSVEFFTKLGYTFNAEFTDENATCMVISDTIYVMLLVEPFFKTFTNKEIVDTSKTVEVSICLSADSRAHVDEMLAKALAAGAVEPKEPQDMGFMYGRDFEDLDGHAWSFMYMEPSANEQPQAVADSTAA